MSSVPDENLIWVCADVATKAARAVGVEHHFTPKWQDFPLCVIYASVLISSKTNKRSTKLMKIQSQTCPNTCRCFFNCLCVFHRKCVCVCACMCGNIKGDTVGRVTQLEFAIRGAESITLCPWSKAKKRTLDIIIWVRNQQFWVWFFVVAWALRDKTTPFTQDKLQSIPTLRLCDVRKSLIIDLKCNRKQSECQRRTG